MSETLIGVLIGGVLSSFGTWVIIAVQHKRWVVETRIARLNLKREKLEEVYEKTLSNLGTAMTENSYSSNMTSDIDFLFPEEVSKTFAEFMAEKPKSELKLKQGYYNIASAMKKSLNKIDDEIDSLVLGKHA